jgi:hypothetical protein
MAVFMRELKTVLRPVVVSGCQSDCDPVSGYASEIGLWVVCSVIHIDTGELSSWPITGEFSSSRLQYGCDVGGASSSKSARIHPDINRKEFRTPALVCCMRYSDQSQQAK